MQHAAQELFAEAVGAEETLFSTNGSSMSARVAIMAVCGPGETLVMSRNGHKSAFAALVLSGARPVYVDPDDWLRDERHIDVELVDHRRIMPLVTFAHDEQAADRFVHALRDLVDERGRPGDDTAVKPLPSRRELRTEQAMLPRDAFFAPAELVKAKYAVGRVSAEFVTPYPPGIPAVAIG